MDEKGLLSQVIAAARAGQQAQARKLLQEILAINPRSETAWLWLSTLVDNDDQKIECLRRVLRINPENQSAHRALSQLKGDGAAAPSAPEPVEERQAQEIPGQEEGLELHCPSCSAEIQPGHRFCMYCGNTLPATEASSAPSAATSAPSAAPASQPRLAPQTEKAHGAKSLQTRGIIIALALVLGAACLAMVVIFPLFRSGKHSSPENAARGFLEAIWDDDCSKAAGYMSPNRRDEVDDYCPQYYPLIHAKIDDVVVRDTIFGFQPGFKEVTFVGEFENEFRTRTTQVCIAEEVDGKWYVITYH